MLCSHLPWQRFELNSLTHSYCSWSDWQICTKMGVVFGKVGVVQKFRARFGRIWTNRTPQWLSWIRPCLCQIISQSFGKGCQIIRSAEFLEEVRHVPKCPLFRESTVVGERKLHESFLHVISGMPHPPIQLL